MLETLTVTCLTCQERFAVRLEAQPQVVPCTFCGTNVAVPTQAEAARQRAAKALAPVPPVEGYALAESADSPQAKPARRTSAAKHSASGESGKPPVVTLECPTCRELVKATVGPLRGTIPCTFCGVMLSVPDQQTLAGWQAKKIEPRRREEIGEYTAGPAVETIELTDGGVFDKLAEIRQEVAPPPPRWTFFSRVFTFPWQSGVLVRWAYLSVGFTLLLLVLQVLMKIIESASGIASGVAAACFVLPLVWISIMTFSYAAACGLSVLESTAAGLDQVEAWPDPNWKEWMGQMIYLGWIAVIPLGLSYGLALLAGLANIPMRWTFPAAFFLIFPFSLMSAYEAHSIWVPLTLPVLGSLIRWWWTWLTFYFLTSLMAAALALVVAYAAISGNAVLLVGSGPIVAAASLVYFRLFGRLAWRMTARMPKKRKSTKQPDEARAL